MKTILAPLDGSSLARSVLPHLVALTRDNGTTVTLLRVLEDTLADPAPSDAVDWHLLKAEAQTNLGEMAAQLQAFELDVQTDVLEGTAADQIIAYAQQHAYDLVALSSHGQGGLSSWPLSSVAQKIILRVRKSILLVPAYHSSALKFQDDDWGDIRYHRILVPLDGSPRAESVLNQASVLARYHEAELLLVHVVAPPPLIQRLSYSAADQDLIQRVVARNYREAERYFAQLQARLTPQPQTRIMESEPVATALHRLIQQENVDLVMLSAHGQMHSHKLPYGHLPLSLIMDAAVPLFVLQDLSGDEIEPTQAESSRRPAELSARKRWKPPALVQSMIYIPL
jgi:nucleotide-binding universal stress UspA family protein